MAYSGASHFANNESFEVQRTNHFEVVLHLDSLRPQLTDDYGDVFTEHLRLSTKSITQPKINSEAKELKHGNETVKVASAPTWDDLTLTVHDTLGIDQIHVVQRWFERVFNPETKLMGNVKNYKVEGTLYMYSPDGNITRVWNLHGVWPRSFGMASEFSFDSSDTQSITVELSIDRYEENQL